MPASFRRPFRKMADAGILEQFCSAIDPPLFGLSILRARWVVRASSTDHKAILRALVHLIARDLQGLLYFRSWAELLHPSFFSLKHSVKEAVNLRTRSGLYSASIVRAYPYPTTSKSQGRNISIEQPFNDFAFYFPAARLANLAAGCEVRQ